VPHELRKKKHLKILALAEHIVWDVVLLRCLPVSSAEWNGCDVSFEECFWGCLVYFTVRFSRFYSQYCTHEKRVMVSPDSPDGSQFGLALIFNWMLPAEVDMSAFEC
jgi:hypothetical protein